MLSSAARWLTCLDNPTPLEPDAGGIRHRLGVRSAATLGPLYEQLVRESVISVKADQVASFLGHRITPQLAQEIGSQFDPDRGGRV